MCQDLSEASDAFRKGSKDLKNKEFWRMVKCYTFIGVILLLVVLFIVMYFCGIDFKQC